MSDDVDQLWKRLQAPFPREQIELKPQVNCPSCTKVVRDAAKAREFLRATDKHCDRHLVRECPQCHAYITSGHIHLDTVGHARTTHRLNEVDPTWTWEPMSKDPRGLPALDEEGNLWIYLTILGSTKPGVGDGDSLKEKIGDAIRNAAMRFGVALDLWARGELPHEGAAAVEPEAGDVAAPTPDVDQDTGEVRMITKGQLINLKALESQLGKGGKDETEEARAERMKFYWWASGEVVDSAKKLTQRGADAVISELQKRVPADA